jgi:hypothetical protein
VSAVCFVRDYVEFHFDGPLLRSLSNPLVTVGGRQHRFPDVGSRDALCRAIGETVTGLVIADGSAATLHMSGGCAIVIPLDKASLQGPEAMHFMPQLGGPLQVW